MTMPVAGYSGELPSLTIAVWPEHFAQRFLQA